MKIENQLIESLVHDPLKIETFDKKHEIVINEFKTEHLKHENNLDVKPKVKHSCNMCGKTYLEKFRLSDHIEVVHERKMKYQCKPCDKTYTTGAGLRKHKAKHDPQLVKERKSFKCDLCGKEFLSPNSIKYHLDSHHERNKLNCEFCNKTFIKIHEFENHLTVHKNNGKKDFKCELCGKDFETQRSLSVHVKSLHFQSEDYFKCSKCDKAFASKYLYNRHLTRIHKEAFEFQCHICEKVFISKANLVKHKEVFHETNTKCTVCGKQFADSARLKIHQKIVHTEIRKEKQFKCKSCEREYFTKKGLVDHIREFHEDIRKYECNLCDRKFHRPRQLRIHIEQDHEGLKKKCDFCNKFFKGTFIAKHVSRIHEKKKDHKCIKCNDSFYAKKELEVHMKTTHQSINYITCQECNKEIKETSLKNHIKSVHENLKNHKCDLCKKYFSAKNNLQKHVQGVHGSEAQLKKCDICGKEVKESNLKTHMKIMHENSKRFPCDFCNKVLSNKSNLTQHVINVHKPKKLIKCEKCNLEVKENSLKRHVKENCKKNFSSSREYVLNIHEGTKKNVTI